MYFVLTRNIIVSFVNDYNKKSNIIQQNIKKKKKKNDNEKKQISYLLF